MAVDERAITITPREDKAPPLSSIAVGDMGSDRAVVYTGPAPRASSTLLNATVILPAYNEATALPHVLDALLDALDDRCEIIVVDDASTDGTAAIARRYTDFSPDTIR